MPRISKKSAAIAGIVSAGAIGVAGGSLAREAYNSHLYNQAKSDARTELASVSSGNKLLNCKILHVAKGPELTHRPSVFDRKIKLPSLALVYNIENTDKVNNSPWLADGGTRVAGRPVEVKWSQRMSALQGSADVGKQQPTWIGQHFLEGDIEENIATLGDHDALVEVENATPGDYTIEPRVSIDIVAIGNEFMDEGANAELQDTFAASCGSIAVRVAADHTISVIDR